MKLLDLLLDRPQEAPQPEKELDVQEFLPTPLLVSLMAAMVVIAII